MFSQLKNYLHYKSFQLAPTLKHLALGDSWCSKCLGKGEISSEVEKWVLNKEAKPGVAFGNVKTGNPLRLIICASCVARQLKTCRPLLNFIYNHLLENYHYLLRTPPTCLTKQKILTKATLFKVAPYNVP